MMSHSNQEKNYNLPNLEKNSSFNKKRQDSNEDIDVNDYVHLIDKERS